MPSRSERNAISPSGLRGTWRVETTGGGNVAAGIGVEVGMRVGVVVAWMVVGATIVVGETRFVATCDELHDTEIGISSQVSRTNCQALR